LARLSAVTDVIRRLKSRLFPERQIYFRANGVVRYIAIAPHWQMAGAVAALAFVGWVGVASANLIFKDQIIAAKERQLEELSQSYEELANSMQRLQADVVATTQRLKERQNYFHRIIGENDGAISAAGADSPAESSLQEPKKSKPLSFRSRTMGHKDLESELAALEVRQRDIAGRLLGLTNSRLLAMESLLSDTGLSKESLLSFVSINGAVAQGGPLQTDDSKLFFDDETDDTNFMSSDMLAMKKPELDPFAELLVRQNELRALSQVLQNAPFARPVKSFYISSHFGRRSDPITQRRAMHSGLDMAGWPKSPIYVTADGRVTKAGRNGAYGNFVEVDHGNGFRTRYGHMSVIKVKAGDHLKRGAVVGLMGSTGRSTGTHLHYEIWFADRPLNPLKFFEAADDVHKIQNSTDTISS
jgi:murein DD-endopeptidase MepM/ murein hydrolase activator NlpD